MSGMPIYTKRWLAGGLCALSLLFGNIAQAAGLLTPADGRSPPLEIRDHEVKVVIEDGYAITTVEQVFHNPHGEDLEAIYSFPVPEHGSVAEFTMWIDGKPVTGEVIEKQQARQIYQEEKAAGRDAGLTEKDAYKTFDIRVSPVRAKQETRIRLVYLQPAHVDTGVGRYVYPLEEGGVDEAKLAFWTANDKVARKFSFDLRVKSAYPIEALRVPNQGQAKVVSASEHDWTVDISSAAQAAEGGQPLGAAFALDKDIVVYWRHKEGLPGSVDLVTYKPEAGKTGTFMLVVTPGEDLKPITEGKDWIFVLDISGSMQGKYQTLAHGVERALGKLRPNDRFRIVLFNDRATELTPSYVNATPEAVREYSAKVSQVQPNNGTNLYAGIKLGLDSLEADRTSAIVLVTDGVANVGETQERAFVKLLQTKDVRLFTAIMGNSSNRPLLQSLTKASSGFAVNVSNSDDIVGKILEMSTKVTHEALHGVKLRIDGVKTADITPADIGSLYRGQQLVMFGHYWGEGEANVTLTARVSGQEKSYRTRFAFPATSRENPELERLWAYARIESLVAEIERFGEKADMKQAVVDLGTQYGLVTDYTSMIVLREEEYAKRGIDRRNAARLAVEQAAQAQRAQQAPVSRRVDQAAPMFTGNRPSYGGGAIDPWSLLLLLPLVWIVLARRERHAG